MNRTLTGVIVLLAWLAPAFASEIEVSLNDELIALEAKEAPLGEVLAAVAEVAGFELVLHEEMVSPVTITLTDMLVDEGVKRLLGDIPVIMRYRGFVLTAVYVLVKGEDTPVDEPTVGEFNPPQIDSDRGLRLQEVGVLVEQSDTSALADVLYDSDASVRRLAVIGIGKQPIHNAALVLSTALQDEDRYVRQQAVVVLGRMSHGDQTADLLSRALLEESDPGIRRMAAKRLGRMGNEQAISVLRTVQGDPDPRIQGIANRALKRLEHCPIPL